MVAGSGSRLGTHLRVQQLDEDDDDDGDYMDEDEDDGYPYDRRNTQNTQWHSPPTEPEQPGHDMLVSGEFGRVGVKHRTRQNKPNISRSVLKQLYNPIPMPSREDIQSVRTVPPRFCIINNYRLAIH